MNAQCESNSTPRSPVWPLSLVLAAVAPILFWVPGLAERLQYDHQAVAGGELWRLVTCHWTHWHGDHLIWDLLVFACLGFVCERVDPRSYRNGVWLSVLLISVGILLMPDLETYRGLSGIDSALYVLLAIHMVRRLGKWGRLLASAALIGFWAKLIFEVTSGHTLFVPSTDVFVPVPLAHLLGAVAGMLAGMKCLIRSKPRAANPRRRDRVAMDWSETKASDQS